MSRLTACPRCRALFSAGEGRCPECGQSLAPRLARERGGIFDRLAARGAGAVRMLLLAEVAAYAISLSMSGSLLAGMEGGVARFGEVSVPVIWRLGGLTWDGVVTDGEPWRLVCPVFLHFNLLHILFNGLCIASAGRVAEMAFGPAKFLALFLATGIAGSVASLAWHGAGPWIGAGASGAGFGILGLSAAFAVRTRNAELKHYMLRWAVYGLVLGFAVQADNAAHLGGLVAGFTAGALLRPAARTRLSPRAVLAWDVLGAAAVLVVLGSFAAAGLSGRA